MIKYLRHNEIDFNKWDACIADSINGRIYALSWYLDIVSPEWDALVLNDYEAIMPLTWKKKYGLKYLIQPPFCQQLGIFFRDERNKNLLNEFIKAIPLKFFYANINLNDKQIELVKYGFKKNRNQLILLDKPYEKLFESFNKYHRKNIRRAQKNKVTVSSTTNINAFLSLFMPEMKKKANRNIEKYIPQLTRIIQESIKRKSGFVYRGTINDEIVTVSLFLQFNNRIIILASSTNLLGRDSYAHYLVMNEVIKKFSGTGSIFDFEGSNIQGIADFNRGFNAIDSFYQTLTFTKIPFTNIKIKGI